MLGVEKISLNKRLPPGNGAYYVGGSVLPPTHECLLMRSKFGNKKEPFRMGAVSLMGKLLLYA